MKIITISQSYINNYINKFKIKKNNHVNGLKLIKQQKKNNKKDEYQNLIEFKDCYFIQNI